MAVEGSVLNYLSWTFSNWDETKKFLFGPIILTGILLFATDLTRKMSMNLINRKNIEYDNEIDSGNLNTSLQIINFVISIIFFTYLHVILYYRFITSINNNLINSSNSDFNEIYYYLSTNSVIDIISDIKFSIPFILYLVMAIIVIFISLMWPYVFVMIWKNYKNGGRGLGIINIYSFKENFPKLEFCSRFFGILIIILILLLSYFYVIY